MKRINLFILASLLTLGMEAQSFHFSFIPLKKGDTNKIALTAADTFNAEKGYGFDLLPAPQKMNGEPFFFSVNVPDGNYKVTVTLGNKKTAANTCVRAESRRLFVENTSTKKNEFKTFSFVVNKRNTKISPTEEVKIKPRERRKLNWDDKLTIEINGDAPAITALSVERVEDVPTVFLCGNSTVVDQDDEPWASWGQMIPRFFTDKVCFANYAESGESANTFIAAGRLKKLLTQMKKGDFIFVEFGHNDQKQKGPGKGAYYSFATSLKTFIDEARLKGATIVFVTPTQRRSFDEKGKIKETHENYPEAMEWVAKREGVPVIDLHQMTRVFYETMGIEPSKKAFVHYPAHTFPGQDKAFEDNTHFNPYGAYELAKCVIEGIKKINLPIKDFIREDYKPFNPAQPDLVETFHWNNSPFIDVVKPDGN